MRLQTGSAFQIGCSGNSVTVDFKEKTLLGIVWHVVKRRIEDS